MFRVALCLLIKAGVVQKHFHENEFNSQVNENNFSITRIGFEIEAEDQAL